MDIRSAISHLPHMECDEQAWLHHCKEGKGNAKLCITRTVRGHIYHCFHCGESGGVLEGSSTDHPIIKRVKHSTSGPTKDRRGDWTIPKDSTSTYGSISPEGRLWLDKYITPAEVTKHGIQYSVSLDRILLPVWNDERLCGYQSRRLSPSDPRPKYLTYVNDRDRMWYYTEPDSSVATSNVVVIVEDMLSAIVCSRYVSALALFGTSIKDSALQYIIDKHNKFLIFLDDDNAQVRAAQRKLQRRLDTFSECVTIRGIGCDPKDCDDATLKGLLV